MTASNSRPCSQRSLDDEVMAFRCTSASRASTAHSELDARGVTCGLSESYARSHLFGSRPERVLATAIVAPAANAMVEARGCFCWRRTARATAHRDTYLILANVRVWPSVSLIDVWTGLSGSERTWFARRPPCAPTLIAERAEDACANRLRLHGIEFHAIASAAGRSEIETRALQRAHSHLCSISEPSPLAALLPRQSQKHVQCSFAESLQRAKVRLR